MDADGVERRPQPRLTMTVDWAVQSKHPGARMGYEITATSMDYDLARQRVWSSTTGTPEPAHDREHGGDAAWVVFSGGDEDDPGLCIVTFSPSTERDATGQLIVSARLLLLPWPDDVTAPPGLVALNFAATDLRWQGVDGPPEGGETSAPLRLRMRALDPAYVADTIDRIGFTWAATAAALLLDGAQVIITTPDPLKRELRVAVLDAVFALLPYGCRAWLTAATWASSRTMRPVHIAFASDVRGDQVALHLGDGASLPSPRRRSAIRYRDGLARVRDDGVDVQAIVAHLATLTMPLSRDAAAEDALDHLTELRLASAVEEEIEDGLGRVSRVSRLLDEIGWDLLPPRRRAVYVRFLVACAVDGRRQAAAARRLLEETWCVAVAEVFRREIAGALAGDHDRAQAWFTTLMRVGDQRLPAPAEEVATLLREAASAPETAEPMVRLVHRSRIDDGTVWSVLAEDPRLGAPMLHMRLAGDGTDGAAVHDALTQMLRYCRKRDWLQLPHAVANGGEDVDPTLIERADDTSLLLALRYAAELRPAIAYSIAYDARDRLLRMATDRRDAGARHGALPEVVLGLSRRPGLGGRAEALVDLLSVWLNETMPFALEADDLDEVYLQTLRELWRSEPLRSLQRDLGPRIARAVVGEAGLTERSAGLLARIVDGLNDRPLFGTAIGAMSDALRAGTADVTVLDALDARWSNELLRRMGHYAPRLDAYRQLRACLTDRASITDIAVAFIRYWKEVESEAVGPLRSWLSRIQPAHAFNLLHTVSGLSPTDDLSDGPAGDLLEAILSEPERASTFTHHVEQIDRFAERVGKQARKIQKQARGSWRWKPARADDSRGPDRLPGSRGKGGRLERGGSR